MEVIRCALRESHRDHVERVESALASFRRQLTQEEGRRRRAFKLVLDTGMDGDALREQIEGFDAEVVRLQGEPYHEEGVRVIEREGPW